MKDNAGALQSNLLIVEKDRGNRKREQDEGIETEYIPVDDDKFSVSLLL